MRLSAWSVVSIVCLSSCHEQSARPTAIEASPAVTPERRAPPQRSLPSAKPLPSAEPEQPWPLKTPAAVETDWCIELVSALDEETCYVLPDKPTRTLLVYLHGIVPPTKDSLQKTNFETVVANAARRAGVAALIPRGEQGLAPKGHDRWWGWPTTGPTYQRLGAKFITKFGEQQKRLEAVAGVRFDRLYVAGSSSGAYFAAAIALHGGMKADGFGAMSGGAGARTPELAQLEPKPFYIGYGEHDTVAGGARALGALLKSAGWPVKLAAHPVGHGAKEIYLDEAFAFWREHAR